MEKFTLTRPSLGFSVNLLQAPALNPPYSFDKHAAHRLSLIRFVLLFTGELQYSLDFIGRFDGFFSCRALNVTYSTSFRFPSDFLSHPIPIAIQTYLQIHPSLLPLQNQVHLLSSTAEIEAVPSSHRFARPTWDKYATLLPTTTVQSQTASRTRRLHITGNFRQNLHLHGCHLLIAGKYSPTHLR